MSKQGSQKGLLFAGGGSLALLLFLFSFFGLQAVKAAEGDAIILETLEVEAQEEGERPILDLEQSFEESFIREKVFSEKIEAESIPDVKAAAKELPNVSVRAFGGFSSTIEIRGLSGDRIISVVDGARISNQGLTYRGGGEINMLDISMVDSIEVIKGSPSVIYDPGATGGVLLVETKQIAEKDHLKLKYTFGYDDGREKAKNTLSLSGAKHGFGAALSYSRTNARDYQVRNKAKLQEAIDRTNNSEEERVGSDRLTDLGFQDESLALDLNYLINENHSLSFKHSDFEVEDSTFVIPGFNPVLFHIHVLSRESDQAHYQIKKLGLLQDISLSYADQGLIREATEGTPFILDSQSANARSFFSIWNTELTLGGEAVVDEAKTQVLADQDYWAGYLSAEHVQRDWTLLAGIRANHWEVQAMRPPGQDAGTANDRDTVLGQCDPDSGKCGILEEIAYTYAGGLVYALNDANNVSLNYSKTHRFPSLFERFIEDGTFAGGGFGLRPEEAQNIEAAWKYYDGLFSVSVSIFYSDFENYIDTKSVAGSVGEADLNELQDCIRLRVREHPEESPEEHVIQCQRDDVRTPIQTTAQFSNVKRAVNRGFEVSLKRVREADYEAGLSFGLSDFDFREFYNPSDEKLFSKPSNPLEFNFYYKHYFPNWRTQPWLKLKGRYVTDTPHVEQEDGFSAFFIADFFAGFKLARHDHSNLSFNAGIRNLSNKIYHEPLSPLDGLKRTFFFNLSVELGRI